MSLTLLIIFIIIAVALLIATFFFSKIAFKILSGLYTVIVIISIIMAVMMIQDVNELNNKYPVEDKLFLLDINGNIEAGFIIGDIRGGRTEDIMFIESIPKINSYYNEQDYENIIEDYFKIIFVKDEILDINSIEFGELILSKKEAFNLLKAKSPKNIYANMILEEKGLSSQAMPLIKTALNKEFISEYNFKDKLFGKIFAKVSEERGPEFIIQEYKNENIEIYPKTIIFKAISFIPESLLNNIARGVY